MSGTSLLNSVFLNKPLQYENVTVV